MKPPSKPNWSEILKPYSVSGKLRMEPPMLVSDHKKDMKWFGKGLDLDKVLRDCAIDHNAADPNVSNLTDLLAECDEMTSSMQRDVSNEHIQTSFEALKILAECTQNGWTEEQRQESARQDLKATKVRYDFI